MKRIKETYLLFLIVMGLISIASYSTYALFTASSTIENVVNFEATLTTNSNIIEYEMVTVPAGEIRIIELNVTNIHDASLYYGAWYQIISPSDTSNINIGLYTDKNSTPGSGQIAAGTSLKLLVGIQNTGTTDALINIGTMGSLTSNLGLGTKRTLLASGWEEIVELITSYEKIDSSNANAPAYAENLVPVMYNGTTWVTADITSSTSNYGWYDYDAKKWANAVLLTEAKRNSLTKNKDNSYVPGQTIGDTSGNGVLAFYVWIPRYKYKVWNKDKIIGTDTYDARNKGIDIVFEEGGATTGGISCTYSYAYLSSNAGSPNEKCTDSGDGYYTHPAFKFGNDELTGIWMGKFELSSETPSAYNGGDDSVTLTPRILPNVISWRGNYLGQFWKVIKDMQVNNNIYGLSTDTTVVDTHMLTNMEWGAVAYLTHSKYGRCTGGDSSTCTEVTINSNISWTTGYSNSTSYSYTTTNGQLASTTGNIYGIYDMNGGSAEHVMGNMSSSSGSYKLYYGDAVISRYYTYSGNEKYLTTYAYGTEGNTQNAYNAGRLGDATSEVVSSYGSAWYSDAANFPYELSVEDTILPWIYRGSAYNQGTSAGVFSYWGTNGAKGNIFSTRAALAVLPQ